MMRYVVRDGVRLAFTEHDGPGLSSLETVVLIHGWADRRETLATMAGHFRARRHRVLSVDLRGHGQSDKPQTGYDIGTLADDVTEICRAAGAKRCVLIGHSLGGMVALEMAARQPASAASVVAVDSPILMPADLLAAVKPLGDALRGPHWKEGMQGFIESSILPTDDAEVRREGHRELDRLPQHVHAGILDAGMRWDAERAARACRAPFLYIEGASALSDLARLRALCPQLVVGKTVGLGHVQMVRTPAQVCAMTDRFLEIGRKSPGRRAI